MNLSIRIEEAIDKREVEELTRNAFWNVHVPGCNEHYLVHKMRQHHDFIPELDFVAVLDERIVGSIMYTKSRLVDEDDNMVEALTFGPISVLPEFQRRGIGSALIRYSKKVVSDMGYPAIIIEGHPHNYCKHGFKGSKEYNVSDSEGNFPYALLVHEIENDFFAGHKWKYYASPVYNIDQNAAGEYDKKFPHKEKKYMHTQEEFKIASKAYVL